MAGINILPGVYYQEKVQKAYYGEGGEIPCFIGVTNNSRVDATKITRYNTFKEISKSVDEGGIGATGDLEKDLETNPLLRILKDFYEETEPLDYDTPTVPYIYVVDVGVGENLNVWYTALETCKTYRDINLEVYYGIETLKEDLQPFIDKSMVSIQTQAKKLDLRRAFTTITHKYQNDEWVDVTDTDLINLAQANTKYNRLNLIEPTFFGKIMGKYCITRIGEESGYSVFNTIPVDSFKPRTPREQLSLQNSGVVFCRDEYSSNQFYPKINLGVCTCFGNPVDERPADALDSNRRIADYILMQVFDACYPQIKARETRTQIVVLQTKVNNIVYNAIENDLCVAYNQHKNPVGTQLVVEESDNNPYAMIVKGSIQPVNCTIAINVEATITQSAMKATEEV
jgi:hypothetical protein